MRFFVLVIAVLIPSWVGASDFRPVQERSEFVGLTLGKSLKAFAVTLQVTSEGAIRGRALGRRVDGEWVWRFRSDIDAGQILRAIAIAEKQSPAQTLSLPVSSVSAKGAVAP